MLAHQYIKILRNGGYIPTGAWEHIDKICIYVDKGIVYKAVIDYYENELSKINRWLKKHKKDYEPITSRINIINDVPKIKLLDKLIRDKREKYPRMTLIFDRKNYNITLVSGEPEKVVLNRL